MKRTENIKRCAEFYLWISAVRPWGKKGTIIWGLGDENHGGRLQKRRTFVLYLASYHHNSQSNPDCARSCAGFSLCDELCGWICGTTCLSHPRKRLVLRTIRLAWYSYSWTWPCSLLHYLWTYNNRDKALRTRPIERVTRICESQLQSGQQLPTNWAFFIGLGPILFGTAVLLFFTYLLLDLNILNTTNDIRIMSSDLGSWQAFTQMFGNLGRTSANFFTGIFSWNNLLSWQFYVFLYLTFAIGSSITLSRADLEGVWKGFGALVGLIFLFNLATLWIGDFAADLITAIASYFGVFSSIMFLVILLNIVVAGLILLPPRFVPTVARVTRSTFRRSRYD